MVIERNERRVVVLGAGYAGLPTAQRLARQVSRYGVRVSLVNAGPSFVERPRLHQVAAGQRPAVLRLSNLLRGTGVDLVVGRVTAIEPDRRAVRLDTADGPATFDYDTVVYALGSTIDVDDVPGIAAHARTLASPQTAARVHEEAEKLAGSGATVVVCGGGLTGIEAAAEFAEAYPGLRVRLVTRGEPGAWLSARAHDYLRRAFDRLGVEVIAGAQIVEVRPLALALADGAEVPFDLCLWAGGFTVPALARASGLAVNDRGRILVDRTLRSVSHHEVYAIGDAAAASGRWGEEIAYGCRTGGFMAPYVADAIADSLAGCTPKPFGFRYVHQCISLGRRDALVQFVRGVDESAGRWMLTGRMAVRYKEMTLRGAVWYFRRPGPYLRRHRRPVAAVGTAGPERVPVNAGR